MKKASIIFPHRLFEENPAVFPDSVVYLVEEFLFFKQYNFHRQKLKFHRASMKFYLAELLRENTRVVYIESNEEFADIRKLLPHLIEEGYSELHFCDPADNWLERRIRDFAGKIKLVEHVSPMFLNTKDEITGLLKAKRRYFQTDFYIGQRKQRHILLDGELNPVGGKWTFDTENRLKYPKGKVPPAVLFPLENEFSKEAEDYVNTHFPKNYGIVSKDFVYPTTYDESRLWLRKFLEERFEEFGKFEDAVVASEKILHHSVLSPMLNVGLLTPRKVIETSLAFAREHKIPLNSLEGFIRQIIGWREFIRGVYEVAGSRERTMNFWKFERKIPKTFWTGETGILPIDLTIRKVLETGYCHHIERLMVLGNFMLLCEFSPDEVYRWFMEMFIDSYDWVMVTNVYGMSQFADGGLMASKPYISGSNYLSKMSDFPKGDWQPVWDGLFWRFMDVHRDFFLKNPRLGILVRTFDKMSPEKRFNHLETAENYLAGLDSLSETNREKART